MDVREQCARYIDWLPLPLERRQALLQYALRDGDGELRECMASLHRALAGATHPGEYAEAAQVSEHARALLAQNGKGESALLCTDLQGKERLVTMPPFNRTSMAPRPWAIRRWRKRTRKETRAAEAAGAPAESSADAAAETRAPRRSARGHWHRTGTTRRVVLLALILAQTYAATHFMAAVLPYHGTQALEISTLSLFAILFAWVSAGFWTAMAGFLLLAGGNDPFAISRTIDPQRPKPIDAGARTAIVMPIANESVPRVFAGLRATYESVQRAGELEHFDFFVLSDSSDPDIRVAEVDAWLALCGAVDGFGRIFYRWRQHRIKRKSGNIADFCRRWGSNYRYMIVLDADSVMSGDCLAKLVRMSEANPGVGIIQTAPKAAGRDTLYARVQQFATGVYGPIFTAGLHFWQLGESHYWGHNAIIRVAPFMRYCALGRLPGSGALSGEILSHDFVEAALMRRAGWAVWIAYDVPGSYEEMPPNLVDELKRDRRWCQGNLMNFRLFMMQGLHPAHRAVFMTGVMAYLSAPLWFLFLILSTALLAVHTLGVPQYFVEPYQLFPNWPQWHPEWAIGLFSATATLLFLPKLAAAIVILMKGARAFGGAARLLLSVLGEMFFSALLAPIRMLFHTQFVFAALGNWRLHWKSPPREDNETTWREAVRRHGTQTLLGSVWAAGVYWLNPSFLWWLLPVVGALMMSIPLSVFSSRIKAGRRTRSGGFFLIPEESQQPAEITATVEYLRETREPPDFIAAVVDPLRNAISCLAGMRRVRLPESVREQRTALVHEALVNGPSGLSPAQKSIFLADADALSALHFAVWTSSVASADWRLAEGVVADVDALSASSSRPGAVLVPAAVSE